jgi:hypothetical protein
VPGRAGLQQAAHGARPIGAMRLFFAFLLMLLLPLGLIWLPIPGAAAAIGGLVGGYVAGRPGRALLAALLPLALVAIAALLVATGLGLPILGAVLAGVALVLFVAHSVALLAGAIIGGLIAQSREPALTPAR